MNDADADAFAELFPAVYLRFHVRTPRATGRRDGKGGELGGASRAVLQHLEMTGPLTVGEAARHLDRAQSVVSEIVDHLEEKGLLTRVRDPRDKRRTLVWLTDEGLDRLARDREVLSRSALARAMAHMTSEDRAALLRGMRALLRADEALRTAGTNPGDEEDP